MAKDQGRMALRGQHPWALGSKSPDPPMPWSRPRKRPMRLLLMQLWPIWGPRQVLSPHNRSMVCKHRRHWRQVNRRDLDGQQIMVGMGPIELGATRTIGGAPRLWRLGEQLISSTQSSVSDSWSSISQSIVCHLGCVCQFRRSILI
jgi:hypothetical protein